MKFKTLIFKEGLNTTVRRSNFVGMSTTPLSANMRTTMMDIEMRRVGLTEIKLIQMFRFSDLRDVMLRNQHDPATRTKQGLLNQMLTHYDDFHEDEIVYLISFTMAAKSELVIIEKAEE